MNTPDPKASSHYLGDAGQAYFDERFTRDYEFGRRWQSRYFKPYCANDKVVLDFGCGDGTILRSLPALRRLAVEVNPHCVREIHERNVDLNPSIEVHSGLSEIPSDLVHVLVSNHSLEHVHEPIRTLQEMLRTLAPGGMLLLVTPFDDWRARGGLEWRPGDRQNHLYTWSPLNLGNLLVEAGFEVSHVRLKKTAWSPRIFWVHRALGDAAFAAACQLLSVATKRCEVFAVAIRPHR